MARRRQWYRQTPYGREPASRFVAFFLNLFSYLNPR